MGDKIIQILDISLLRSSVYRIRKNVLNLKKNLSKVQFICKSLNFILLLEEHTRNLVLNCQAQKKNYQHFLK